MRAARRVAVLGLTSARRPSEVAPALQALRRGRTGELVDRHALRAGAAQLGAGAVRDLEAGLDLDAARLELGELATEGRDAVHEHRLLALEMAREQQGGRLGAEAHHRHARPERLD